MDVRGAQTPALASVTRRLLDAPRDGQRSGPLGVLLAYRSASQHVAPPGIKAGLGILKLATARLKTEKKAVATPPDGTDACGRSPLDQLAALLLRGHTRHRQVAAERRPEPPCAAKPQNCKRIVVLGAPRVGKTSILRRYLQDGFAEEYRPTTEDFLTKLFRIRGETYQIDVLDASGERDFPAKRRLSILTGDIFLLVFSLDDRSSFKEVCALRAEILAAKSKLSRSSSPDRDRDRDRGAQPVALVVCANKVDVQESRREVTRAEALRALGDDCPFFETSAKDSTNLERLFEALAMRGGLPAETGPSRHRRVSLRSYQAMRAGRGRTNRAAVRDDACGALYPLARRPSFSTDLRRLVGPRTARDAGRAPERCRIQ